MGSMLTSPFGLGESGGFDLPASGRWWWRVARVCVVMVNCNGTNTTNLVASINTIPILCNGYGKHILL